MPSQETCRLSAENEGHEALTASVQSSSKALRHAKGSGFCRHECLLYLFGIRGFFMRGQSTVAVCAAFFLGSMRYAGKLRFGMEEKMKKRQELQQQINELQNQLRQHQLELKREEQEKAKASTEDGELKSRTKSAGSKESGISDATMTAIISADASMDRVRLQENAKSQMEGTARIMRGEAKLDKGGAVSEKKLEKAAELEGRVAKLEAEQMKDIAQAGNEIRKSAEADRSSIRADQAGDSDNEDKSGVTSSSEDRDEEKNSASVNTYTPIDVISDGFPTRVIESEGNAVDEKR